MIELLKENFSTILTATFIAFVVMVLVTVIAIVFALFIKWYATARINRNLDTQIKEDEYIDKNHKELNGFERFVLDQTGIAISIKKLLVFIIGMTVLLVVECFAIKFLDSIGIPQIILVILAIIIGIIMICYSVGYLMEFIKNARIFHLLMFLFHLSMFIICVYSVLSYFSPAFYEWTRKILF